MAQRLGRLERGLSGVAERHVLSGGLRRGYGGLGLGSGNERRVEHGERGDRGRYTSRCHSHGDSTRLKWKADRRGWRGRPGWFEWRSAAHGTEYSTPLGPVCSRRD